VTRYVASYISHQRPSFPSFGGTSLLFALVNWLPSHETNFSTNQRPLRSLPDMELTADSTTASREQALLDAIAKLEANLMSETEGLRGWSSRLAGCQ